MNSITQHIPNFVDKRGLEIKSFEFETLEELFAIPFVKYWQDKEDFYRWSITDDNMLMAEQENGKNWWVVGYIKGEKKIELPIFKYPPEERKESKIIDLMSCLQPKSPEMEAAIKIFQKQKM